MKIKMSGGCHIIGFLEQINHDYGEKEIQNYVECNILPRINSEDVDEWTLILHLIIRRANLFGVFRRGINYLVDKEKEISILVPIPDASCKIKWGFPMKKNEISYLADPKKYITIPFNHEDYDNAKSYIIDCTCRCLRKVFTQGYTIAGKKIKFTRQTP